MFAKIANVLNALSLAKKYGLTFKQIDDYVWQIDVLNERKAQLILKVTYELEKCSQVLVTLKLPTLAYGQIPGTYHRRDVFNENEIYFNYLLSRAVPEHYYDRAWLFVVQLVALGQDVAFFQTEIYAALAILISVYTGAELTVLHELASGGSIVITQHGLKHLSCTKREYSGLKHILADYQYQLQTDAGKLSALNYATASIVSPSLADRTYGLTELEIQKLKSKSKTTTNTALDYQIVDLGCTNASLVVWQNTKVLVLYALGNLAESVTIRSKYRTQTKSFLIEFKNNYYARGSAHYLPRNLSEIRSELSLAYLMDGEYEPNKTYKVEIEVLQNEGATLPAGLVGSLTAAQSRLVNVHYYLLIDGNWTKRFNFAAEYSAQAKLIVTAVGVEVHKVFLEANQAISLTQLTDLLAS